MDLNVGQSKFRCDLTVRSNTDSLYQLGILVDTDGHYANPNLLDRYLMQPSILRAFGWRFALVLTKDWYHNPDDVLGRIEKMLLGQEVPDETTPEEEPENPPVPIVPTPANEILVTPTELSVKSSPPSSPEPTTTSGAGPASVRLFEFVGDSLQKFWEISLSGNSFTVRFGRIGTAGQSPTKSFADDSKAKLEATHLINEKVKKGYTEKSVR